MSDLYETASESTATMSPRLQVGYRNRRRIVCEPHIILPTSSCSFCASTSPPPNPTQRDEAGGRSLQRRRRPRPGSRRRYPALCPASTNPQVGLFFFLPTFLPCRSSDSVAFKRWCGQLQDPFGKGMCCVVIVRMRFDFRECVWFRWVATVCLPHQCPYCRVWIM